MTGDKARGSDAASVMATVPVQAESGTWHTITKVEKYNDGREPDGNPDEVIEREGNILQNAGIQVMLDLLARSGAGPKYTNGALAYIAVSDNNRAQAEDATETNFNPDEIARQVASAVVTNQSVAFSATFAGATGDGDWEEVGVFNDSVADAGDLLNRVLSSLGTKSGATWVITITITIS